MPKVTNPDTPTGRRILAVASRLFYERGIRAVGVDLIADEAGTTKKTIYDRFGSKDALVGAYLDRRDREWSDFVAEHLSRRPTASYVERVLAVLDADEAWRAGSRRGCAFVNAHAEIGRDHPGVEVLRRNKQATRDLFVDLLRDGGRADAESVGASIHLVYEGALVALTVGGLEGAYDEARAAIRRLIA